MIILFDFDSLLYKASYKIVPFAEMRSFFALGMTKEEMREEIVNRSIDRMQNMEMGIFKDIEDTGCQIESVEYYLTICRNSFRKILSPDYKKKRIRNKWVGLIRKKIMVDYTNIFAHDEFEADDLIASRSKGLKEIDSDFVICSLDKDLKQIEGMHYNYYIDRESGEVRGLSYTSKYESIYSFWLQMAMGDATDGIAGIKGIGIKKAEGILSGAKTEFALKRRVCKKYLEVYGRQAREQITLNYRLLNLGVF